MGVPTSEVGYTPALPRREDHEVRKDMWWHWTKKKMFSIANTVYGRTNIVLKMVNHFNFSDRGKSHKCLSQCHFVHHKLRMVWPRIEADLRGEKTGTNPFET